MEACAKNAGNVSDGAQDQRLRFGVAFFTLSLILSIVMVRAGLGPGWRLLLFIPFWLGAQGFFAALYKT